MPRRAAVPDNQPSLFDEFTPTPPPAPEPEPEPEAAPRTGRRHVLGLPRPWPQRHACNPTCLVCGHDEHDGTCPDRCVIVCARPPHRLNARGKRTPTPVEVCLITSTITARIAQGAPAYDQPGRRLAVVTCPRCQRLSWHPATPGRAYRQGTCGHPYIVHTPTP